jgi:hypothetical protein
MRYALFAGLLSFLFSCSSKDRTNQDLTSVESDVNNTLLDTLSSDEEHVDPPNLDSTVYIGRVNYFEATNEFYIPLYYRVESNYNVDRNRLDSVVYKDNVEDGVVRTRLNREEAKKRFYLEGMDSLIIYGASHKKSSRIPIARVELLDQAISSEFVAVYPVSDGISQEGYPYYAIGTNGKVPVVENFSTQELSDIELNQKIIGNLKLKTSGIWVMHHIKVMPSGNVYSTVSDETHSYIVESTSDTSKVLKAETDDYRFDTVFPVPIMVKGKPLLLVSFSVPESDVTGDFVSYYNGTSYEVVNYNRVLLNLITN